jgi:hypothetical protein
MPKFCITLAQLPTFIGPCGFTSAKEMFVNAGEFLFWVSAQRGSVFLLSLLLFVFSVVAAANGFAPKVFFFCRRRLEGCPRGVTGDDDENETREMGIILTTTSEEDEWVKFYARVLFKYV